MKITGIDIGEYRQFKNLKFDFTYPEGHDKAGQPLEKVCFIGQSGTGKTTLLNVIWDLVNRLSNLLVSQSFYKTFEDGLQDEYVIVNDQDLYTIGVIINEQPLQLNKRKGVTRHKNISIKNGDTEYKTFFLKKGISFEIANAIETVLESTEKLALFIKDSVSREADAFLFDQKNQPQSFSDFVKTDAQIESEKALYKERANEAGNRKTVSFGDMRSLSIWQYLLKDIIEYDETTVQHITSIIQNTPKNKVADELHKWMATDPRIELADKCLNTLLDKLFIELDINTGSVPIKLRSKQGTEIPNNTLSTGTRQILATAIPIYKFDTKDTVILFDEPERSLFPDIQRELVKYYTGLAPEAQFFFATHSPIIAAAFEPCERFILYFDENGEVKYRNGVAPIGDDPNDVLRQDFWMNPLMGDEGLAAYKKYLDLAAQIRSETDEERKNQLIIERLELGNRYNFAGQHAPY
ncbi:AAA family ATPase [Spirosoma montaniterrae]|uniref:AAA+ ATPase domain-containing protein n=1 Tax=Spirosoma montaniterrae TaxID=1178516 RepID=A0A1P9WZV9_9BACT|nr:AAA family ATPase [Spirosoma montaniterrae]AQG80926.1 hypothetical protein AWR27_17320 [Spirosoma montaniterrae]